MTDEPTSRRLANGDPIRDFSTSLNDSFDTVFRHTRRHSDVCSLTSSLDKSRHSPPLDPEELASFLGSSLQILIDEGQETLDSVETVNSLNRESLPEAAYLSHRHSLPQIQFSHDEFPNAASVIVTPSGITIRNGQAFLPNGAPLTVMDIAQMNSLLQGNHGLSQGLPKKISLYKTELCRTHEETGFCRYGVKCQFAHDKSELRTIPRHPRYKTEICRTFWEMGNCPYGKRCCFIHLEAVACITKKEDSSLVDMSTLCNSIHTNDNSSHFGSHTAPIGRPYRSNSFASQRSSGQMSLSPRLSVPMVSKPPDHIWDENMSKNHS